MAREVRDETRARAARLAAALGAGDAAEASAAVTFAADLVCASAVDFAADLDALERFVREFEDVTGASPIALAVQVLTSAQLAMLGAEVAVEVQLRLLLGFAGVRSATLWTRRSDGEPGCVARAGDAADNGGDVAKALLTDPTADVVALHDRLGLRLDRRQHEPTALIADGHPTGPDHRLLLMQAAAPVFAIVGDRERSPSAVASRRSVMTSVERRLARLRYDLHDGPQQDVHLLASDLALFREQLLPIVAEHPNYDRIVGRLDDLAAQLVALDGDLRRLASTVQSPFLPPGSLPEAIAEMTDAFARRTGITPQVQLSGELGTLTESQQITLLALIREALSNVREHSDAGKVTIRVERSGAGIEAQVIDDGRGFEPEATLLRAAREGHIGLVGMHERVRMLGGRTQIESRPGGPTTISVSLPGWPPQPS